MVYESKSDDQLIEKNKNIDKDFELKINQTFIDTIDLRGHKVDEALNILEKFIDDAYIAGISKIKIIHGAGKGKLKDFIHKHLKGDKRVKKFKSGDIREKGGSYYTEVEF
jgi:DNA mismatch repair protein MutS2